MSGQPTPMIGMYHQHFPLLGLLMMSFHRVYNYPVYKSDTLSNGEHTFVLQPRAGESNSFVVFDYFAYEYVALVLGLLATH